MLSYVYRSPPISPAKLGNVCNGCGIQTPKRVLIERLDSLRQANFDAIEQQIRLPLLRDFALGPSRKVWGRLFLTDIDKGRARVAAGPE